MNTPRLIPPLDMPRPFAVMANRLAYMPWTLRRSFWRAIIEAIVGAKQ